MLLRRLTDLFALFARPLRAVIRQNRASSALPSVSIRVHPRFKVLCALCLSAGSVKAADTNAFPPELVYYTYQVVKSYPHDPHAFSQGLVFHDGKFLESTGLYGQSSLRETGLNGTVLHSVAIPGTYFAEGLALFDNKLFQLTWREQKCFVYDLDFHKTGEFTYPGEGWGLTTDGHFLIMSDGTSALRFLSPATFTEDHRVTALKNGTPQDRLNELEYIKGEVFANIWQTDWVARIDPATGNVVGMIDFSYLLPASDKAQANVLNGIAYVPAGDRLFVTGKNWPKLFEVKLIKK